MASDWFTDETKHIKHKDEQSFYSLDFLRDIFTNYCGKVAAPNFAGFVEMLVFDALIGSTDRHAQNWGLITPSGAGDPVFAPIFDSAHAVLWDYPEVRLKDVNVDRYIDRAYPCIGPPHTKSGRCNHFGLLKALPEVAGNSVVRAAIDKTSDAPKAARQLLKEFPFARNFSSRRKNLIVDVLAARADRMRN